MKKYDAVVVGGGPIGNYVAKNIANGGFKVLVLEEHKTIGSPLKCAGLVSSRVLDFLNVNKSKVVQNEIYGAHINSPSGHSLDIGGDKVRAFSINRSLFDETIAKQAKDEGAEIFLENKVISVQKTAKEIVVKSRYKKSTKQVGCNILIGADGSHSKIREELHFPQPSEFLRGMGAEVTNTNLNPKYVEIFLGQNIAPGFFAWIIPTNKDGTEARIGLCISNNSKQSIKHYFSNLFKDASISSFLDNTKITRYIGGSIPLGVLKKTVDSNVILVGDAAAQVKPTSGGGIYTGLLCAKHCSSVVIDALNKQNFSISFLKKYHKLWYGDIGRELKLGMKFRKIFKNLNDEQITRYINKIDTEKMVGIINECGDIDYPSKLIFMMVRESPSLVKLLFNYLGGGGGT